MIPLERLSHFRRPFSMEVNMRELVLKHPGIFYIQPKEAHTQCFLGRVAIKDVWLSLILFIVCEGKC
jgi:hypothetical protein